MNDTLKEVFSKEIALLDDAEQQMMDRLNKFQTKANHKDLKKWLPEFHKQTEERHKRLLDNWPAIPDERARIESLGMRGILNENNGGDGDAQIISGLFKAQQYLMSIYEVLLFVSGELKFDIKRTFEEGIKEEEAFERKLFKIAVSYIRSQANST